MYLEGFATVYSETALAINALKKGEAIPDTVHFPTIGDGVDGMMFIDACVKSSKKGGNWWHSGNKIESGKIKQWHNL